MPNQLNLKTQRGISRGFRWSQIQKSWEAVKGWFYGINNSKDWEIVVKRLDGLGINFAHIMQMNLGMDKG